MTRPSFENDTLVIEARHQLELALSALNLLHIGPLDYNVSQYRDYCLAACSRIEELERQNQTKL